MNKLMKNPHVWVITIIVAFIAGGFLIGKANIPSILPYIFVLACPIMMILMMREHNNKK